MPKLNQCLMEPCNGILLQVILYPFLSLSKMLSICYIDIAQVVHRISFFFLRYGFSACSSHITVSSHITTCLRKIWRQGIKIMLLDGLEMLILTLNSQSVTADWMFNIDLFFRLNFLLALRNSISIFPFLLADMISHTFSFRERSPGILPVGRTKFITWWMRPSPH